MSDPKPELHKAIGACLGATIMAPHLAYFAAINGRAWATSHRIAEGIER